MCIIEHAADPTDPSRHVPSVCAVPFPYAMTMAIQKIAVLLALTHALEPQEVLLLVAPHPSGRVSLLLSSALQLVLDFSTAVQAASRSNGTVAVLHDEDSILNSQAKQCSTERKHNFDREGRGDGGLGGG